MIIVLSHKVNAARVLFTKACASSRLSLKNMYVRLGIIEVEDDLLTKHIV